MSNITQLSESLTETIKDGELQNVSIDILEVFSDTMLEDGLLKDIPILGTLFGIGKATTNIKDKLFSKKLLHFLFQFKEIPKEERLKQISKVQSDPKYRTKVGEKLLYIVDKCEDSEKADLIGRLFKCFLEEKITYTDFLRCVNSIENIFLPDLLSFIKNLTTRLDLNQGSTLVTSGIMAIDQIKPKVTAEKSRYSMNSELTYKIEDSKLTCTITHVGSLLKKLLQ